MVCSKFVLHDLTNFCVDATSSTAEIVVSDVVGCEASPEKFLASSASIFSLSNSSTVFCFTPSIGEMYDPGSHSGSIMDTGAFLVPVWKVTCFSGLSGFADPIGIVICIGELTSYTDGLEMAIALA